MTRRLLTRTSEAICHWARSTLAVTSHGLAASSGPRLGPAIMLAGLLAGACVALPGFPTTPPSPSTAEMQKHLDQLWAEQDWVGVIAWLESFQKEGVLTSRHKEALYAAYIAGAAPLVEQRRFKEARGFLERARSLAPDRPEAKDLLATRERDLTAFLFSVSGGPNLNHPATPFSQHIQEVAIAGEEATVMTDLPARESNKPIARAICGTVLEYQPAALEAVTVLGVKGWTAARCTGW